MKRGRVEVAEAHVYLLAELELAVDHLARLDYLIALLDVQEEVEVEGQRPLRRIDALQASGRTNLVDVLVKGELFE